MCCVSCINSAAAQGDSATRPMFRGASDGSAVVSNVLISPGARRAAESDESIKSMSPSVSSPSQTIVGSRSFETGALPGGRCANWVNRVSNRRISAVLSGKDKVCRIKRVFCSAENPMSGNRFAIVSARTRTNGMASNSGDWRQSGSAHGFLHVSSGANDWQYRNFVHSADASCGDDDAQRARRSGHGLNMRHALTMCAACTVSAMICLRCAGEKFRFGSSEISAAEMPSPTRAQKVARWIFSNRCVISAFFRQSQRDKISDSAMTQSSAPADLAALSKSRFKPESMGFAAPKKNARGGSRTRGLWLRRPTLYPTELPAQKTKSCKKSPIAGQTKPRETTLTGKADLIKTACRRRAVPRKKRNGFFKERETGLEPATSTLARLHSTTELLSQFRRNQQSFIPSAKAAYKLIAVDMSTLFFEYFCNPRNCGLLRIATDCILSVAHWSRLHFAYCAGLRCDRI